MIAFSLALFGTACTFFGVVFNDDIHPNNPLMFVCPGMSGIAVVLSLFDLFNPSFI